jgi:hypothetical protein
MKRNVRSYLAEIGRRGGRKSRRALDPETARAMVRVREARRAYRRFHAECFWSYDPDYRIGPSDVVWVADQLHRHGGRDAWEAAGKLFGPVGSHETPPMTIEREYRARVNAMSIVERIRRAEELFNWSRDYMARSIVTARGPMPDDDLRWEIALRQYGADPAMRKLIDELRSRASR